ncbi:MAG TPA: DUF881 domain-containing protein [Dermatophilaceae bacterium]|nr:DUF881 domain-containing protein [Dermatophilaceae bacterium]
MPRAARSSVWRLLVPLVFASAGLLFSTSFQTAQGTDLRSDRGLPGLVADANREVAAKAARVQVLQAEVDALTEAKAPDAKALTSAANSLAPRVGTRAVQGPAVVVTLDDSQLPVGTLPGSIKPDDLVVHQQDVQAVVNALWRGGAEAMMIQDQRVIATSAVRCVGNTLILQGRVYSPPFTIAAIGPVDQLRSALDKDDAVGVYRQWVDAVGLGYEVRTESSMRFPAYTGVSLSYATASR